MILTAIIAVEFAVWFYKLRLLELPGLIGISIIILVGLVVDWMRCKR